MRLSLLLILVGCGASTSTASTSTVPDGERASPEPRGAEPPPTCLVPEVARRDWNHHRAGLVVGFGEPHHYVFDVIAPAGGTATLRAKLSYGTIQKDLEDEAVVMFIRREPCGIWEELGEANTDRDGRIAMEQSVGEATGIFALRAVVAGDGTWAEGRLFVLEPGATVAVFDIDGTLTATDSELVRDVIFGEEARAHEGAVDVVRHHASLGRQPIFITGRPYFLSNGTRRWLTNQGFAPGPLFMTSSVRQASGDEVQTYKREILQSLMQDFSVEYAYGNASTDVCAYAEAGVPAERTFIIGEHAGSACEGHAASQAVSSYPAHLESFHQQTQR